MVHTRLINFTRPYWSGEFEVENFFLKLGEYIFLVKYYHFGLHSIWHKEKKDFSGQNGPKCSQEIYLLKVLNT